MDAGFAIKVLVLSVTAVAGGTTKLPELAGALTGGIAAGAGEVVVVITVVEAEVLL